MKQKRFQRCGDCVKGTPLNMDAFDLEVKRSLYRTSGVAHNDRCDIRKTQEV